MGLQAAVKTLSGLATTPLVWSDEGLTWLHVSSYIRRSMRQGILTRISVGESSDEALHTVRFWWCWDSICPDITYGLIEVIGR
jgi:hypothetical protein